MIRRESQLELSARWQSSLARQRWPMAGMVELTWACTFGCRHCYLPDHSASRRLDGQLVMRLLDEMSGAGCLNLCWTGGEPLLHPQFFELHERAVRLGFWVTLFSNGSLLDAAAVDHLTRFPPRSIEITLYGGDEDSYTAVTGSAQHFEHVKQGVDALLERGHKVLLKAMLTRDLEPHLEVVQAFAQARGQTLRLDNVIDRCLDGGDRPLEQRQGRDDATLREATRTGVNLERLRTYDTRVQSQRHRGEVLACGAAQSGFFVDARGCLTPCVMLREPAIDLTTRFFAAAWQELSVATPVRHAAGTVCGACEIQHLCNLCPGVATTMPDAPEHERAYYCQVASCRAELVRKPLTSGQAET